MRKRLFLDAVGDRVRLAAQAGRIAEGFCNSLPTSAQLESLSRQYSVNVATLVLEQCLRRNASHGRFIQQIEKSPVTVTSIPNAPRLVVVPGLYYKEHSALGSDAGLICEIASQFGIRSDVVPTKSLGSIEENSEILHHHLKRYTNSPFWLASVSRGGAEIKWLLYKQVSESYLANLQGWVSVNGIVCGTRVFDRAHDSRLHRLFFRGIARLNGINPVLVDELHHSRDHWAETRWPPHARCINVVSLPMSWDISAPVQSRYRQLSAHGPNDGAVILGDYLLEPGLCFPVVGVDHLMRKSNLSSIFYRLINHFLVNPAT